LAQANDFLVARAPLPADGRAIRWQLRAREKNFGKKYRRFTGRRARQIQERSLKLRRKRPMEKTGRKQGAEQWKQAEIQARADASPGHIDTPQKTIARRREAPGAHIQD
jgi:hypothetical protein